MSTKIDYTAHAEDLSDLAVTVPINHAFSLSGDGLWGAGPGQIHIAHMEVETGGNAGAPDEAYYWEQPDAYLFFDPESWDTETMGLVYTDSGFIESLRAYMVEQQLLSKAEADSLDYTERGLQSNEYISVTWVRRESWPYEVEEPLIKDPTKSYWRK